MFAKIFAKVLSKIENSKRKRVCYHQPDDKINVMVQQIMTPNEKKRMLFIQPDDGSDQNVENIIIQPDVNIYSMLSSDKMLTPNLPLCYHPAQ